MAHANLSFVDYIRCCSAFLLVSHWKCECATCYD